MEIHGPMIPSNSRSTGGVHTPAVRALRAYMPRTAPHGGMRRELRRMQASASPAMGTFPPASRRSTCSACLPSSHASVIASVSNNPATLSDCCGSGAPLDGKQPGDEDRMRTYNTAKKIKQLFGRKSLLGSEPIL